MSSEIERRLNVLEKKVMPSLPHPHGVLLLFNPSQSELEAARKIINDCPRCATPHYGAGPSIIILEILPAGGEKPLH